jgi:hypothetical protein
MTNPDPIVFHIVLGRPTPTLRTIDRGPHAGRLFTAEEIARLFGGDENYWFLRWENHWMPDVVSATQLFTLVEGKPVPLLPGEIPPEGVPFYTHTELWDEPHNFSPDSLITAYATAYAQRGGTAGPVDDGPHSPETDSGEDAVTIDGPFTHVVPVAEWVAKLTASGLPPVTALYTVALAVVSDIAVATQSDQFPQPDEADVDDVAEGNLGDQFNRVTATLREMLERYTCAEARRVIVGQAAPPKEVHRG